MGDKKMRGIILGLAIGLSLLLLNAAGTTGNWRGFIVSEVQIVASAAVLWFLLVGGGGGGGERARGLTGSDMREKEETQAELTAD